MAYLYIIDNFINNKLIGGDKSHYEGDLQYFKDFFDLSGRYGNYDRLPLKPNNVTDLSNENNDLICHNFDVTRQMFSVCDLQTKDRTTNDEKITNLFNEITSQLEWMAEFFKRKPLFITGDAFNQYIQVNVVRLSRYNPNYRRHFINLLEQFPTELIDLYGYQEIL